MSADMFLELKGIPGESTDNKHADCIEISSWSTSYEQPASPAKAATGPSVEKCKHEPITVAKIMDKSTPELLKKIWTGKTIKEGKIYCYRADEKDGKPVCYLTIELGDILIAGYSLGGAEGDLPQEELQLSCAYVKFIYDQQAHVIDGATGNLGASVNTVTSVVA